MPEQGPVVPVKVTDTVNHPAANVQRFTSMFHPEFTVEALTFRWTSSAYAQRTMERSRKEPCASQGICHYNTRRDVPSIFRVCLLKPSACASTIRARACKLKGSAAVFGFGAEFVCRDGRFGRVCCARICHARFILTFGVKRC